MHMGGLVAGVDSHSQSLERIPMQLRQFFLASCNRAGPTPVTTVECEQNRKSDKGRVIPGSKTGALDQISQTGRGDKPGQQGPAFSAELVQEGVRWLGP